MKVLNQVNGVTVRQATIQEHEFAALHREFQSRVLNYVRRRVASEEAAEEIAADVFRVAWQKVRADPDALSDIGIGWFLRIAHHLVGNEYRGRKRAEELRLRLEQAHRGRQESAGGDADHERVSETLQRLRDKDREILILAYWDDLRLAEIASILHCSESAAGVRLFRARKAFARNLPSQMNLEGEG
ncbi:RNA polymerase sigma factor [Psychromicrobium xiongbiense]|uniref:RNA polymerase sigma factor n=1 Tax=Psychromicrobium xiongbiense TaxID=3051184 RepID=UPI002553173F|nr:sigma-70 family RNA polymerase sigma factor [Psychromicrobium sp. YIM S02556]